MGRDGWTSSVLATVVASWATLVLGGLNAESVELMPKVQPELLNTGYSNSTIPAQSNFDAVFVRVFRDINTECKACPHAGCINKDWYGSSHQFVAKCWTAGSVVGNTNVWLQSESGCYVTKYDTIPYWRDYITDLKRCGNIPEQVTKQYTTMATTASCRICPNNQCEVIGNYSPKGKVTLTCHSQTVPDTCTNFCIKSFVDKAQSGADARLVEWYRTINNCYVPAESVRGDTGIIGSCGPVPFLKGAFRSAALRTPLVVPPEPLPTAPYVPPPTLPLPPARQPDIEPGLIVLPDNTLHLPQRPTWTFSLDIPPRPTAYEQEDVLDGVPPPPGLRPKLYTSHLTLPFIPTPLPKISNIIPPKPFMLSLPTRPPTDRPEPWRLVSSIVKFPSPAISVMSYHSLNLPPRPTLDS